MYLRVQAQSFGSDVASQGSGAGDKAQSAASDAANKVRARMRSPADVTVHGFVHVYEGMRAYMREASSAAGLNDHPSWQDQFHLISVFSAGQECCPGPERSAG